MEEISPTPEFAASLPNAGDHPLPPLDPFPAAAESLTEARIRRILLGFLLLGVAVRAIRFLLCFPLWPDEAYLAHNYLDRSYLGLLKPLDFIQIAPILYLWVQKTLVSLLGFSEYSLRLYSLLCGVASLFVFRYLAGRLLRGTALVLAFAVFAVAYPLVRYSGEAKPYGADMLISLILVTLAILWQEQPERPRRWWALTLAMPLAVLFSYPAAFMGGGICLAMAIELLLRRDRRRQSWLRWIVVCAALAGGAAVLFGLCAREQMEKSGPAQQKAFQSIFPPPLSSPGELAIYLLANHTGDPIAYPLGGKSGAGALTALCCLTALILLLRSRRFFLVALCVFPMVLNFAIAAQHEYPYGSHARFFLYMGSLFCVLTGLGGAAILAWIRGLRRPASPYPKGTVPFSSDENRDSPHVLVVATLWLLAAIAVGISVRDFWKPYKDPCFQRDRDFARWFWTEKSRDGELVCLKHDFGGRVFYCRPEGDDLASIFYCNQRIYWPRLARGEKPQWKNISKTRPLRCVRFRPSITTPRDEEDFQAWLRATMTARKLELVGREAYPISFWVGDEFVCVNEAEVYEFAPREPALQAMRTTARGSENEEREPRMHADERR